jgi:hypothetical protein
MRLDPEMSLVLPASQITFSKYMGIGARPSQPAYPITPDGRYFVVRGRLWRLSKPTLKLQVRKKLVAELMRCRRRLRGGNLPDVQLKAIRGRLHSLKEALGERGAVWWTDGAPDYNRFKVENTPYRGWYHRKELRDSAAQ